MKRPYMKYSASPARITTPMIAQITTRDVGNSSARGVSFFLCDRETRMGDPRENFGRRTVAERRDSSYRSAAPFATVFRMRIRTVRRDPSTTGSQVVSALIGGIAGVAAGVVLAQLFGGAPGLAARARRGAAPAAGPEAGYDADWEEPEDEIEDDDDDVAFEPSDDGLGERVLEAFVNDPILAERAIDIEVQPDATVALSGAVDAEPEVAYAATLARGVPGVKRVVTALVTPA